MRITALCLLILSLALCSCKDNRQKLLGSWHSVKLENKDIDSFFIKSQLYIDTIGKNNDEATNIAVYGTANVDSLRKLMQVRYDSAKNIQARSVTNTIFTFRKDSILLISFNGNIDTCSWVMDSTNKIAVEDLNTGGGREKMSWEIMALDENQLVLKIPEDSTFSKITFKREGK